MSPANLLPSLREKTSAMWVFFVLILMHFSAASVISQVQNVEPNDQAEQYVRAQLAKGEPADLAERFPNPDDRGLGPDLVYELAAKSSRSAELSRQGMVISHAVFLEGIDLKNAEVPIDLQLLECYFKEDVELSQSHFKKSLTLNGSHFSGVLNLIDATVDGNLGLSRVQFTDPKESEADLEGVRVGGYLDLQGSVFAGNAIFIRAVIGGNLDAQGTRFTNPEAEISFDSIKVNGYALFKESNFRFSANFAYANFAKNLGMENVHFGDPYEPDKAQIIFNSMKVGLNAFFHQTVFNGWVDFGHAEIGGNFEATQAQFNSRYKTTSFIDMKTGVADFSLAKFATTYHLTGMQYEELKVNGLKSAQDLKELTAFMEKAVFTSDTYSSLEAFLKGRGMEGSSNDLYIAQKRRERAGLNYPGKMASVVLDLLVGYGRRPWLAFVWSAFFVLVGWVVFRQRKEMSPSKPEYEDRPYSPFLYSLDLFLPFVNLRADEAWEPRRDRRWARRYVPVHTLLGWILIPIGLAAVSGLIR